MTLLWFIIFALAASCLYVGAQCSLLAACLDKLDLDLNLYQNKSLGHLLGSMLLLK
jgi:hypothetical protein